MDCCSDSFRRQMLPQPVATLSSNHVQMMNGARIALHQLYRGALPQFLIVNRRDTGSMGIPFAQMRQEGPQKTALHFIEPRIDAEAVRDLIAMAATVAQDRQTIARRRVIHDDPTAIAQTPQIFRRIKTIGDISRKGGQWLAVDERPVRLRRVLNQRNFVFSREPRKLIQRARLTVQMHRHQCARFRRDARSGIGWIHLQRLGIDVGKPGKRSGRPNADARKGSCERAGNNFTARDTGIAQAQLNGSGAVGDADRKLSAQRGGEFRFEGAKLLAQNEMTACEQAP